MAAMNLNPDPNPRLPPLDTLISRGMLIPSMIDADDAPRAIARLATIDPERYAPFRVIAVDHRTVVEATWDRVELMVRRRPMGPVCFVSSGLGDHFAAPRLQLFDAWFAERGVSTLAQDDFHRHRWSDRPEISVNMSRADARTVSTTAVTVGGADDDDRVVIDYRDDDGPCRMVVAPAAAGPCLMQAELTDAAGRRVRSRRDFTAK
jgi:hypothetical protein